MEKDNFNVVHIIKERGVCPDISLFLFVNKNKRKEERINHSEAKIV